MADFVTADRLQVVKCKRMTNTYLKCMLCMCIVSHDMICMYRRHLQNHYGKGTLIRPANLRKPLMSMTVTMSEMAHVGPRRSTSNTTCTTDSATPIIILTTTCTIQRIRRIPHILSQKPLADFRLRYGQQHDNMRVMLRSTSVSHSGFQTRQNAFEQCHTINT